MGLKHVAATALISYGLMSRNIHVRKRARKVKEKSREEQKGVLPEKGEEKDNKR
jgi:hypothetical protein